MWRGDRPLGGLLRDGAEFWDSRLKPLLQACDALVEAVLGEKGSAY